MCPLPLTIIMECAPDNLGLVSHFLSKIWEVFDFFQDPQYPDWDQMQFSNFQ